MKVLAYKEKKSLLSRYIIIISMIILLVILAIRLSKIETFEMICIFYVASAFVIVYLLVKEISQLIKYNKLPKELIYYENDSFKIYANDRYNDIKINDIKNIKDGENDLRKFFYQASLIIETNDSKYEITNINNYLKVKEEINELIK